MREKILAVISALFFKFLRLSLSFKLHFKSEEQKELFNKLTKSKKPDTETKYIVAFFHQDEFALIPYFMYHDLSMLVSHSKDGEIMTRAIKTMGCHPVRGSSSKGAVAGLIACIKKVRQGFPNAMAVDGPRGPIYKVKEGVIALSEKTQTPIIPVRSHPRKYKLLEKAWNQGKIPYPFSKVDLHIGEIKFYERQELEEVLTQL